MGYLNNGKQEKGKEYNGVNKLKFENKFLNGLKSGKGKEYDQFKNIIFEGEY